MDISKSGLPDNYNTKVVLTLTEARKKLWTAQYHTNQMIVQDLSGPGALTADQLEKLSSVNDAILSVLNYIEHINGMLKVLDNIYPSLT